MPSRGDRREFHRLIRHEDLLEHDHEHRTNRPYMALGTERAIDFAIMYLVMYTMVATLDHFHLNLNNTYMTLMMGAPMAAVMLVAIRSMSPSRRANLAIGVGALADLLPSFYAMRTQALIGNREFLRPMIPHHSGAILMCEEAAITDPELLDLCVGIVEAQQREIARMESILQRY